MEQPGDRSMPDVEQRSHKGLNNRAENAHVPLRKRERMMQGFRSPGSTATLRFDLLGPAQSLRPAPLKTLRSRYTCSPPAGHGGMESRGRGQLTSAAAGLNAFICRQREIASAGSRKTSTSLCFAMIWGRGRRSANFRTSVAPSARPSWMPSKTLARPTFKDR